MLKTVNFLHPPNPGAPRRALSQARPQGAWRLRCTLWGTSQGDMRLRTKLGTVFSTRQSWKIFGSEYCASGEIFDCAYRL